MKTPFDTVLRTRRREIDRVRIAIHEQHTRVIEIEDAHQALQQEMAYEYTVAAEQWTLSTHAYLRRRLAERAQLHADRLAASHEIDILRRRAAETYGSMVVLENAAERFRTEELRRENQSEQRAADDLSAARMAGIPRTATPRALPDRAP